MKKFKITDGFIRKVEKRLLKVAKKDYQQPDGMFVCLDEIHITSWGGGDFSVELKVRWGRMVDGKCEFQHQRTIWSGDGNLDFLAGQFCEKMRAADRNE